MLGGWVYANKRSALGLGGRVCGLEMFADVLSVLGASVAFKVHFVIFAYYASHHYLKTILDPFQSVLHVGLT